MKRIVPGNLAAFGEMSGLELCSEREGSGSQHRRHVIDCENGATNVTGYTADEPFEYGRCLYLLVSTFENRTPQEQSPPSAILLAKKRMNATKDERTIHLKPER